MKHPSKAALCDNGVVRFIKPGEFYFGKGNCRIDTILGSCIALTFWHPILHVGGMCHFVVPGDAVSISEFPDESFLNGRYSGEALALFEIQALKYDTQLTEYHVKMFGGGGMLKNETRRESESVGNINIEDALQHLSNKGVSLTASHVGGEGYRRIIFDINTGDVWVKHESLIC